MMRMKEEMRKGIRRMTILIQMMTKMSLILKREKKITTKKLDRSLSHLSHLIQ